MKEISITRENFLKAAADLCCFEKNIREAIKQEPALLLWFGIFATQICAALFDETEDDTE